MRDAGGGAGGGTPITDDDVVESYRASVRPDGVVAEYLRAAQVAAVIGDTLFVHGGVTDASMAWLPADDNRDRVQAEPPGVDTSASHSVQDWAAAINDWAQRSVQDWLAHPRWDAARARRGGEAILGCGHLAAMRGRTVMVSTFCDEAGQPLP